MQRFFIATLATSIAVTAAAESSSFDASSSKNDFPSDFLTPASCHNFASHTANSATFCKNSVNPHQNFADSLILPSETMRNCQLYSKPSSIWNPHLDVSFTAGTTGLGFDFSMPINRYVGVRVGASFMPQFSYPLTFTAQIGEGNQMTADGLETRFERMATLLEGFVGQEVDDKVDMTASPYRVNQFKFMVDVTPFRRKNWHFTTGFYLGQSKIARCINKNHEIATLFAVNLYNRLYENNGEIALGFSLPPDILVQILSFGQAGFPLGQYVDDVVYTEDVWVHDEHFNIDYIEHAKGEVIHPKGSTYLLAPNDDNTVFVDAFVNKFRPYFGIGYNGAISRDKRWSLGVDAGIMMWGGAPKLMDHSGVDLMYDLKNIEGQVGDYVKLARHMKAYPIVELKITHRLF